jgi:hypothetical protein
MPITTKIPPEEGIAELICGFICASFALMADFKP